MGRHDNDGAPRPGLPPGSAAGADLKWAAQYLAWLDREAAAGRRPEPRSWAADEWEPWDPEPDDPEPDDPEPDDPEPDDPGAGGSAFGGPAPANPAPSGPGRPLFAANGAADVMPPSPFLAALTEQAVSDVAGLSDAELVGVLRASRRLVAREQYKQALAAAEFGRRRRAAFEAALARGVPAGCAEGGFPGEELSIELTVSRAEAGHLIDDAIDLTSRLPRTLAGMAAGLIDAGRAGWIALYTRSLTPAGTARADEVLAGEAPELRVEQLARKAAALEMKLNPDAVKARRERARRDGQRVEARREASGNACLAGRELDTADVLASKAYLDAVAARLRACGLGGSLDRLRALALMDLTQGRDPLSRINGQLASPVREQPAGTPPSAPPPAGPPDDARPGGDPGQAGGPSPASSAGPGQPSRPGPRDQRPGEDDSHARPARPARPSPVPALVTLLVSAETLLGLSTTPAQAGAWGLLDADGTRTLAAAAAAHPATRWCLTLTGPDGTALAHGCARGPRPRLLDHIQPQPPPAQPPPAQPPPAPLPAEPPPAQPPPAPLAELLRRLNITLTPIARGNCDHAAAEGHYTPSRKLAHLVRARTATCDAPGCDNPAATTDLDHTLAWPAGPTRQSNLAPRCRTHHRAKQAPDWAVEQIGPGVTRWTLPSGRSHITAPTKYDT
jgi:Domain of unknown function (DUF222)